MKPITIFFYLITESGDYASFPFWSAGPCQHSHSWFRVMENSSQYFTASPDSQSLIGPPYSAMMQDNSCVHIHYYGHMVVSTIEELLGRKSSGSGLEIREYGHRDPSRWPRGTLYPQKLAPTSLTRGGCLVGIVRSQTQATEFSFLVFMGTCLNKPLHTDRHIHKASLTTRFLLSDVTSQYLIFPWRM
jgi:hypothetical protein